LSGWRELLSARRDVAATVCFQLAAIIWLCAISTSVNSSVAEPLPRSVLFIDQENQSRVWNFDLSTALRSVLSSAPGSPILVYADNLDLARFAGSRYEESQRNLFREKYRDVPIGVIVVNGTKALDFALSLRPELWPRVPIVFAAVDDETAERMRSVPNVTGHIMRLTLEDMVAAARLFVPDLKRMAIVGDRFERNTFFRSFLQEFPRFTAELEFIDLTGLPMDDIKRHVAALPGDAAIGYMTLTVDGAGVDYLPREAVAEVAKVANRPIVTNTENFINYGAAGGFVVSANPIGEQAGRYALRLLGGESSASIPVVVGDFIKPIFDWRALERWRVNEAVLPPGAELRFRSPSTWEQYRLPMIGGLVALVLQSALITWLLIEHRRRSLAEAEASSRRRQAVRLNRVATATVLSSSIAHELSQPLGAILINTETVQQMLRSATPDLAEVDEVLSDIVRDDQRASEILHRQRTLLKKGKGTELQVFDLNDSVREIMSIVAPEASKRGVLLNTNRTSSVLSVRADRIQMQQVILNLVMNGMDALESCHPAARKLTIRTSQSAATIGKVTISDSGAGIPADKLMSIFDAFFTTKPEGTGLGLPIARTIIESCGGAIWAENGVEGGAAFHFTLPLSEARPGVSVGETGQHSLF
jgi:signal transduction histidine kinase